MKLDRESKLFAWFFSIALAACAIVLFIVAMDGLQTGEVPTMSKYGSSSYISGIAGRLLAGSYISLSSCLAFCVVAIVSFNQSDKYFFVAKLLMYVTVILLLLSFVWHVTT